MPLAHFDLGGIELELHGAGLGVKDAGAARFIGLPHRAGLLFMPAADDDKFGAAPGGDSRRVVLSP